MYTYDFRLSARDHNAGTVYLPNTDSKALPVIIYCHGWGGRRKLWAPTEALCEKAIAENIALVTFDYDGCGDTGGDIRKMTYTRWKNNLSDILTWVFEQEFADKSKIGCYAFSSGSTAALRLSAEDGRISFIISVGTCISTHIGMGGGGPAKLFADNAELLLSGGTVCLFKTEFGLDFFKDTISRAPIFSMDRIKCPVLFLQGTADNPYRVADAKIGYDLMRNSGLRAEHVELDGGTHELDNMPDTAMRYAFGWLLPILAR